MHACTHETGAAARAKQVAGRWLSLQGCAAREDGLLPDILALAMRIEPDRRAVWEWLYETPIHPYGNTAVQLMRAGQDRVVMAFLRRVLSDGGNAASMPANPRPGSATY